MKIPTTNQKTYKGRKDGNWTEEITGSRFLFAHTAYIHKSHSMIKAFEIGVITCAYNEEASQKQSSSAMYQEVIREFPVIEDRTHIAKNHVSPEYVYEILLPIGTRIVDVGVNEIRFVMPADAKINLVGEMGEVRIKDDSYNSRVYGGNTINVFTKKYK